MQEETIRKQTENLISAFTEATGAAPIFTIADFLKLRETAINELRAGDIREKGANKDKYQDHGPAMQAITVEVEKPRAHENIAPGKFSEPRATENRITQFPAQRQAREEHGSDLEILRSIADPWN